MPPARDAEVMAKVAGLLVASLIAGIVTTRGASASHVVCPGTTAPTAPTAHPTLTAQKAAHR